jgi:hypothetical protein
MKTIHVGYWQFFPDAATIETTDDRDRFATVPTGRQHFHQRDKPQRRQFR